LPWFFSIIWSWSFWAEFLSLAVGGLFIDSLPFPQIRAFITSHVFSWKSLLYCYICFPKIMVIKIYWQCKKTLLQIFCYHITKYEREFVFWFDTCALFEWLVHCTLCIYTPDGIYSVLFSNGEIHELSHMVYPRCRLSDYITSKTAIRKLISPLVNVCEWSILQYSNHVP
jgi:hypothetical protein